MAVLALFVAGSAIGGAAFGAGSAAAGLIATVGATVGSIIDSQFTMPLLFGSDAGDKAGPRVTDLKPQTASEGSPMNFCFGPENRVAGTIIWQTDLVEHEHKIESGGGKGFGMGGGGSEGTTYTYTVSLAIGVCEGPISAIMKIWADDKVIFDFANGIADFRSDSINFYLGSGAQTADPVIQAHQGAGFVPGFRGTAYIVMENLKLEDFGNRIPNFTFLVQAQPSLPVRDAIALLCARAGLVAGQWDTDHVPGCIRGYNWQGPQSISSVLIPILNAYSIRTQESQGAIRFFPRGGEDIKIIDASLLGARDFGSEPPPAMSITDTTGFKLPTEVQVNYVDPSLSNQRGSVGERRQVAPTRGVSVVDVPFTINQAQALKIAKQTLWTIWSERQSVTFYLPPSVLDLEESDVVQVDYMGNVYQVRILELERGANFVLKITGVIQDSESAVFSDTTIDPREDRDIVGTVYYPPLLNGQIMDLAPLRTLDTNAAGYYRAVSPKNSSKWKGAGLLWSDPSEANFVQIESIADKATAGITLNALPASTGFGKWDTNATVDVLLYSGSFSNDTRINVLGGSNTVLIGDEIVAFQEAELIATNTYRLSNMIRGLRDTNRNQGGVIIPDVIDGNGHRIYSHDAGERVVLLNSGSVAFNVINTSVIGTTKAFRFVPVGGAVDDVNSKMVLLEGNTLRPFPPCRVRGTWDGASNTIEFSWVPVTRDVIRIFGQTGADTLDGDHYEVRLWLDGTGDPDLTDFPILGRRDAADLAHTAFFVDGTGFTYDATTLIGTGIGGIFSGPDHDADADAEKYNIMYHLRCVVIQVTETGRESKPGFGPVRQNFRSP